jgi:hypothetical protein
MRSVRFGLRLLAAVLTFAAGVLLVAAWLAYPTGDVTHLEDTDCFRTEPAVTSVRCTPPAAPLNLCEVSREPERYGAKIIRVRAQFIGYHLSVLYGPECNEPRLYSLVEFENGDLRRRLLDEIAKIDPAGASGDPKAEVVVIGRFEVNRPQARAAQGYFGNEEAKRRAQSGEDIFSFTVLDVERVSVGMFDPPFNPR